MREIKFRAWDKINKKMIYEGFDIDPKGNMWMNCLGVSNFYILMQYIGLKDKNGKEIYEGDVVDLDRGRPAPDRVLIEFYYGSFGFCGQNFLGDDKLGKVWFRDLAFVMESGTIEVIGNIHQSPELLK